MPDNGVDGSVVININGNTQNFDDSVDHAKKKALALESALNHAVGDLLADALRNAASGLKDLAEEIVQTGISFESAFAGVKKTIDETATMSYEDINNDLREMAKNLPATYEEIAGVAEAAGQLGIKTENVTDFTQVMIDLGEATNLSADEAAVALAQLANVTKMSADDYDNMGSAIVHLGNNMATTESDIVAMAQRLGSTAAVAGISNQNIVAMAAALGSVGVSAEVGGTAMSSFISKMQASVSAGDKKLAKFAETAGMTSDAFAELFNNDAMSAIEAFIEGLHKIDAEGGDALAVLSEVGVKDTRMKNAILSLAKNGEILGNAIELSNKAWAENTALSDEAAQRYQTTESQLKILQNRLRDFYYDLSQSLGQQMPNFLDFDKLGQILDRVKAKLTDGKLAESLAGIATQLFNMAEKGINFAIDEGLPDLLNFLKWISDNGDEVVAILRAIAAEFVTDQALSTELAGEFGKIAEKVSEAVGEFDHLKDLDINDVLTKTGDALKDAAKSWDLWTMAVKLAAAAGEYVAAKIDQAGDYLMQNAKYENGFTDEANEAWQKYAEIKDKMGSDVFAAGAFAAENIEEDKKALKGYQAELSTVSDRIAELEQMQEDANPEFLIEGYDEELEALKEREEQIKRLIDAYLNLTAAEEGAAQFQYEHVKTWKEQLAELDSKRSSGAITDDMYWVERKRILEKNRHMEDHEWQVYMDEVTQHYREAGKTVTKSSKTFEELQEKLAEMESEYSKQSTADQKKNAGKYWQNRISLINEYRDEENEEWWKVYNDAKDHYDTLIDTERSAEERAQRERLKSRFDAIELQADEEVKDKQWVLDQKRQVIEELDHGSDLYKEYDRQLRSDTAKLTRSMNEEAQKRFQSAAKTIGDETQDAIQTEIKSIKSAFDDLAEAYQHGYDEIIGQRDKYKKYLMGGSIFSIDEKTETDARTGAEIKSKSYNIDDLKKRLQDRKDLMAEIARLEKRNLAPGLIDELYNMDPEDALEFAKQLNRMNDTAFTSLNEDYNALDAETTRMANERYAGQIDSLQTNFIDQATALFSGMSNDLTQIGGDQALAYIQAMTTGLAQNGDQVKEAIDGFFTQMGEDVSNGTINLDGVIRDNLVGEGLADELIDGVLAELNNRKDEVQTAVEEIMSLSGQTEPIVRDVEYQSSKQSAAGYAAAGNAANAANAGATDANKETNISVTVKGTLTDEGGRVIANIVNDNNEKSTRSSGK